MGLNPIQSSNLPASGLSLPLFSTLFELSSTFEPACCYVFDYNIQLVEVMFTIIVSADMY